MNIHTYSWFAIDKCVCLCICVCLFLFIYVHACVQRAGAVVSCKMSPSLSDLCALRLANTREDHGDQDQSNKDQDRQDQNDNKKDENGDQVVEPGRGQGDRKQKPALLHLEVVSYGTSSSQNN